MPFKKGNKLGGRRSARTSNVIQSPSPQPEQDASDEEMVDGDVEVDDAQDDAEEEEEVATPAQDDDDDDAETPPTITIIPRRRRGRGGGLRHSSRREADTPDRENNGSESGTPFKRKRGRPAGIGKGGGRTSGGFRGRRKGAPPEAPRVIDKDGTPLDVVNDEAVVDDDPEGNEKVDALGYLQGGREYRVRTFTIIGKGERLYMLSTEPARCCGFRDSYLFFTKHPKLYKVLLPEAEKLDLIDRDILPNSYKGRNIGVVTARTVFREFGARIIVGGRKITDDYKVQEARFNGEVEGELADPEDRVPEDRGEYNRNRYVAWFGASEVYRNVGQSGAAQAGKPGLPGKRRNNLTVQNWQLMHAREASKYNTAMTALRRANLNGVYDTHTNMMFYPKIMQPTHAKWEQIPPSQPADKEKKLPSNGLTNGDHLTNGTNDHDDMDIDTDRPSSSNKPTIFSDVPSAISRNFTVIDTAYLSPQQNNTGYPGPDGAAHALPSFASTGSNGLTTIPQDLVDELPEDCRRAFEEERQKERGWKAQWSSEGDRGSGGALRGDLKIGFVGYPV